MSVTVENILALVEEIAPPQLQEDYDNVGLLAGHPQNRVEKALVGLDLTEALVREAQERCAQLILTHHPIFFRGRKNLREDDPEGRAVCALVRANMNLIAAHTNFDNAMPGVNDALAEALGLEDVRPVGKGMRMGGLAQGSVTPDVLSDWAQERLGGVVRLYAPGPDVSVSRVAVCGGAGGDFWPEARAAGAQALVTGEIGYHDALNAVAEGMCVLEAGHYETEQIALKLLADGLQSRADALKYNVTVEVSALSPFWRFKG